MPDEDRKNLVAATKTKSPSSLQEGFFLLPVVSSFAFIVDVRPFALLLSLEELLVVD